MSVLDVTLALLIIAGICTIPVIIGVCVYSFIQKKKEKNEIN